MSDTAWDLEVRRCSILLGTWQSGSVRYCMSKSTHTAPASSLGHVTFELLGTRAKLELPQVWDMISKNDERHTLQYFGYIKCSKFNLGSVLGHMRIENER